MKTNPPELYRATLHYFAISLSLSTFFLLFAGGMVTSTHSGLSVPDWPTTFGQNMFTFPPSLMKGGIFYEHGHRLIASMVGLLTSGICLCFWIWEKRRWLQWTGTLALLLVIVQGILGGMTVRYKLPMAVSTAHACTAELFFLLSVFMAFSTSRAWFQSRPTKLNLYTPEQGLSLLFCLAVFLQILVGAIMRHSYAGMAIPTFPMAFGQFIPPFWNFGIGVHFLHTRVGALLLVILGIFAIASVWISPRLVKGTKVFASILGLALALQCFLGMFTVWTGKAAVPTTIHLSVGALVFASGFLLFLAIYRFQKPQKPQADQRPLNSSLTEEMSLESKMMRIDEVSRT